MSRHGHWRENEKIEYEKQMNYITAPALKPLLTDGQEIAFLDIREHGQYGEGHPFFSVHVPFSKLETFAPKLVPCFEVRCILMDDGDGVAERAAAVMAELGYRNISILTGGAPAWRSAGFTLFKGVNVPSKTFGELVEHAFDTKSVSAEELHAMQASGQALLVLDGRSGPEFQKMSLPNAKSCPNAELPYRLPMLTDNPDMPIVVNCAGRTRSIIGAETLSLVDVPNPVYALRNGTQGWRLAGLDLVHGATAKALPAITEQALRDGAETAEKLRSDYGLETVSNERVQSWLKEDSKTTYLFDVRSAEEYDHGHVENARSAPGGQLVQATDEQLAVRNARIVLSCDNGLRSATTAIWLKGMGHKVFVLENDVPLTNTVNMARDPVRVVQTINEAELVQHIRDGAKILDASTGLNFRAGHIDGAVWITRARIDLDAIGDPEDWVLTGSCRMLMGGIQRDVEQATGKKFKGAVKGTPETWREAGLSVVASPDQPSDLECIDYLFFVHDRHDGNLEAARRYLEWETGLLAQLDEQELSVLKPLGVLKQNGV